MKKQKLNEFDREMLAWLIKRTEKQQTEKDRRGANGGRNYGLKINSFDFAIYKEWNKYRVLWSFAKLESFGLCEVIGENKVILKGGVEEWKKIK